LSLLAAGRWQKSRATIMTGPEVLDVARDAIVTLLVVSLPLMLVGLVVGVIISLFQALTQIQETTLVFVPKIIAVFVALLLALPFMADKLHAEFISITTHITNG
jgi:flagellar biosynthesis protein FliQ